MSREREKLPEHLAWNGSHPSEAALGALADAQTELVPESVFAHLETCAQCNHALAELATLSIAIGDVLARMPVEDRAPATPARLPIPWRALLAAAAIALVGSAPALLDVPGRLAPLTTSLVRMAPALVKAFAHLFGTAHGPVWLTLVPSAVLVMMGFALTRALPAPPARRVDSEGAPR